MSFFAKSNISNNKINKSDSLVNIIENINENINNIKNALGNSSDLVVNYFKFDNNKGATRCNMKSIA